jgi:hypothetical protein
MTYLGIPIHFRKIMNADWHKVEERFEKKLSSWRGKHLSTGEGLTLINLVRSSLPMHMLSFVAISRGVLKKLDYFRFSFFFGKVTTKEVSIELPSGAYFVILRTRG